MVFRTNNLFEAIRVSDAMLLQHDGPSAHFQVLTGRRFPKTKGRSQGVGDAGRQARKSKSGDLLSCEAHCAAHGGAVDGTV